MNLEAHIRNLYNQFGDTRLVFHNYSYAKSLVNEAKRLIESNQIRDEKSKEVLITAAWFYAAGYLKDYQNPSAKTLQLVKEYFSDQPLNGEVLERVKDALKVAWGEKNAQSIEELLLRDAVNAIKLGDAATKNGDLQRLEMELMSQAVYTNEEWSNFQLQQLLSLDFKTAAAKEHWEPVLGQRILQQKSQRDKILRKSSAVAKPQRMSSSDDAREAQRMIATFFRSNYRVHINLSAIADNKANIMISVNAILVSVLISILSYRNLAEVNPFVMMPAIVFLVSGLISLVCAVLSARPRVTSLNGEKKSVDDIKKNLVFYGNFVNLDLDTYEEGMNELYKDPQLMLSNMTRDMYHLGKVLDKKYRFLSISYNVFMLGFIVTVIMFLVGLFLG